MALGNFPSWCEEFGDTGIGSTTIVHGEISTWQPLHIAARFQCER